MSDGGGTPAPRSAERGDAERLRALLSRELHANRWREGERLPTERALGAQYGVARNTVRRALERLEADALIVRHVGRGTFRAAVAAPAADPFAAPAATLSPADVVECRLVFEPELAPLVVARANAADLELLDECVRGGEAAADVAGFEHWDARLHDAIAAATHNQTVLAMARALARVRLAGEWGVLKARSMTGAHRQALQDQHRGIAVAFRERDRDAARRLLRTHIVYVRSYMFGE